MHSLGRDIVKCRPRPIRYPPTPQEEQLGADSFPAIRSLDLSNLRIRDLGTAFASGPGGSSTSRGAESYDGVVPSTAAAGAPAAAAAATPFVGLCELTLDGNQLTSSVLSALSRLTALTLLRLNGNRLSDRAAGEGAAGGGAAAGEAPGAAATTHAGDGERPAGDGGTAGTPRAPLVSQPLCAPPAAPPLAALLPALQVLQLRNNGLTALGPLQLAARLPALRALDVSDNDLTRLEGLEGLGRLRELNVNRNRLRCGVAGGVFA